MAFRKDHIGERFNIGDVGNYISDDHPCHLIGEVMGQMDFSEWEDKD